jgi:UDP-N-acetylglucosamine acyltransferase
MPQIHPTAVVDPRAEIAESVEIGPYSVVNANVVLEEKVKIGPHVVVDGNTKVCSGTEIWPGAVIGTKTQDLKFRGETTYVEIGPSCQIREFVTINASCGEGTYVRIGGHCLIMAYSHIAHNSTLGDGVILANNATLAGHVTVEDFAIIGGLSAVHQFTRIGRHAMVGGMSRVIQDVPPYTIGAGSPYKLGGLNLVGLRRHKFDFETRMALAKAFRLLYRSGLTVEEALRRIESEVGLLPEVQHFVNFCRSSKRGIITDRRTRGKVQDEEVD